MNPTPTNEYRFAVRGVRPTSVCVFAVMLLLAVQRESQPFTGAVAAEQEKPASTGSDGRTLADSRSDDNGVTFSADEALASIRKQVPTARAVSGEPSAIEMIAGHYVRALPGTLAGAEFYFFPDKTYLWAHWCDISPLEMCDRGTWDYRDGFLRLKTDGTIRSVPAPINSIYLPVVVPTEYAISDGRKTREKQPDGSPTLGRKATASEKATDLILAGIHCGLGRFVKEGADWEYLLWLAYRKQASISAQQLKMTKERVVRERSQQLIKQWQGSHR